MGNSINLYSGYIKFMPNWYMLFKSRDTDEKKLEFLRTILEYAFEEKVPEIAYRDPGTFTCPSEYAAYDAFWAAKAVIDNCKRENQLGSNGAKGGRPSKSAEGKPGGFARGFDEGKTPGENPGGKPCSFINIKNKKENINIEYGGFSDNPPTQNSENTVSAFEEFWKAYPASCPRKYDKKKCREKWNGIFAKAKDPDALFGEIMTGLENWKMSAMWQEAGGKYIRAPLVWLNNESWNDAPMPSTAEGGNEERNRSIEEYARKLREDMIGGTQA